MNALQLPEALAALAPHLAVLFVIIFKLHLLLYPKLALRSLMDHYRNDGTSLQGHVLSCEAKPGTCGNSFMVEIMYERTQNKNANDPSLRFRDPTNVVSKNYVRRFELGRKVVRGEKLDMLVLPGEPRSGCPNEVLEGIGLCLGDQGQTKKTMLWALAVCGCVLGLAIRQVLRLDDPTAGWAVLLVGVCVVELVPFIYCTDQFLRAKRKRFNSARPMRLIKSGKRN
jgi:hypothetical protein